MHWKMVNSHGYVTKGYARFHNSLFCRIVIVCVSITRYDSYLWFLWKWSTFLVDFTYLSLFVLFCFVFSLSLSLSLSVSLFPNLIGVDLFLDLPHSTYGWLTHDQCWRRCILFGWTIWRNNNDTEQNINLHTMFFICAINSCFRWCALTIVAWASVQILCFSSVHHQPLAAANHHQVSHRRLEANSLDLFNAVQDHQKKTVDFAIVGLMQLLD